MALSAGQDSGESEAGQDAVVKACHGADLAAGEGEDEQPAGVGDAGMRVPEVHAVGGLVVGPGGACFQRAI